MYKKIINLMSETLKEINYDIVELETIQQIKKRNQGHNFSFNEHISGLIYSLLSNQRPWKGISDNKHNIEKIFNNFDYTYIKEQNPNYFIKELIKIKCGNRAIKKQMETLQYNLKILKSIEKEYTTLDNYVTSKDPYIIATEISSGKYKLKQIGLPLAMEYLRNVGIDAVKPDVHICRILGSKKLGFAKDEIAKEKDALNILTDFSKKCNISKSEIDSLIWQYCSTGYAEICTKNPKCKICKIKKYCNYKKDLEN